MANARQATVVQETRATASKLLDAYYALRQRVENFDALGGSPAFAAFFASQPAPEISSDELLGVMNVANQLRDLMDGGAKNALLKVRG